MRRNRSGIFHTIQRSLSRATPVAVASYIIVFAVVCSNLIALCVFSATLILDCHRNHVYLPSHRCQHPSTSAALNEMITNITGEGLENMISLKGLMKVLEVYKGEDAHIRLSYIDSVLQHNNLTLDSQRVSEWHRLALSSEAIRQLYRGDNFSVETKSIPHLNKQKSDFLITFPIHTRTSSVNKPNTSHISDNNTESSLPTLTPRPRIARQAMKEAITGSIILSKEVISVRRHEMEPGHLNPTGHRLNVSVPRPLVSCLNYSKGLTGRYKPKTQQKTLKELTSMFPELQAGGRFTPSECMPKENTAIIIPYRNRYPHLHILLLNIVPLLMKQNVKFTIVVIEQELPGTFNRGMLFNVGFLEAQKIDNFDCFIFHDVDIIPINDFNYYQCNNQPTHFLSGVNKYKYKLMYEKMFGGVVAFTQKQFRNINGASNLYFGWGGEDDDLKIRVTNKGYTVIRKHSNIGFYDMIKHSRDESNKINPLRMRILTFAAQRQETEGLSTTIYSRHSVELLPLYTWIRVNINMTAVLQTAPKSMQHLRDQLLRHFLPVQPNSTTV